nr:MAG TPA: PolyVal Metallopeptidase superfamily domain [Caudoviricetes sp.]
MARAKGIKLPQFKVPLFEHTTVFFCCNRDEFDCFCGNAGIPVDPSFDLCGGLTMTCTDETGANFYVVSVFDNKWSTLTHELAHATFHVLGDVGVQAYTDDSHPSNETYAYMIGRMYECFEPVFNDYLERVETERLNAQEARDIANKAKDSHEPAKKGKRKPKAKEALVPRVMSFKRW